MLIVISHNEIFSNEASLINQLFDEGLGCLHMRKPHASMQQLTELALSIKEEYREKLVWYTQHIPALNLKTYRIHFSESDRLQASTNNIREIKQAGNILSTSVHSVKEYQVLDAAFDYTFLSPVFDSISKKGYTATAFDLSGIVHRTTKLVALGGINEYNCRQAFEMGFDGVAALGSIWQSKNPLQSFKNIQKACNTTAQ